MKFHEVETALREGRKIKMASWKNAYWYLNEKGQMINHFEEGKECPTALLFPQDVLWVMTGEWEIVAENAPVVTESPKEETFGFGEALAYLEQGLRVARKGWNGKDQFLVYCPGNKVPTQNMKVKAVGDFYRKDGVTSVVIAPHIDMKASDGTYVTGWLASQTDMLTKDWYIV